MKVIRNLTLLLAFTYFLFLTGCKETPTDNNPVSPIGSRAVFILCEGTWGGDNSTITRYDQKSGTVIQDYFGVANPGLRLGDLASHIAIWGDKCFVSVSTTKTIEAIDLKTGKSLGRLILQGDRQPRKICIINDSIGYVTIYNQNSVVRFDTRKLTVLNEIKVGPAPEGIVYYAGLLYVANSGAGDLMAKEPDAGTIYIIDEPTMQIVTKLKPGPNVYNLIINKNRGILYANYLHLYSQPDSLGGIVEYDLMTLKSTFVWRDRFTSYGQNFGFSQSGDTMYYINDKGVAMIDLNSRAIKKDYLVNPNTSEFWYSLSVSPIDGNIWIGNAKNYQVEGEVLVYEPAPIPIKLNNFKTGIIPNTILFY
jgi:DNA-binding beta-propeller fold protein YncE